MKYLIGAGIGGLFGLSVPLMIEVQDLNEDEPRVEESQPPESKQPMDPSYGMQHLPDNACRYIDMISDEPKEQAKECLSINILAVPAI